MAPIIWSINAKLHATCSCVTAMMGEQPVTYKIGAPGIHLVANSLAVLLPCNWSVPIWPWQLCLWPTMTVWQGAARAIVWVLIVRRLR